MPTRQTRQKAFRLTSEAQALLRVLAERRGVTETATVEQLIREEAERRKVTLPAQAQH